MINKSQECFPFRSFVYTKINPTLLSNSTETSIGAGNEIGSEDRRAFLLHLL